MLAHPFAWPRLRVSLSLSRELRLRPPRRAAGPSPSEEYASNCAWFRACEVRVRSGAWRLDDVSLSLFYSLSRLFLFLCFYRTYAIIACSILSSSIFSLSLSLSLVPPTCGFSFASRFSSYLMRERIRDSWVLLRSHPWEDRPWFLEPLRPRQDERERERRRRGEGGDRKKKENGF